MMKYIIMCAGTYTEWETPKQLVRINNEPLVVRTTRLLVENGVDKRDITVTANKKYADQFMNFCDNVRVDNRNIYDVRKYDDFDGHWCDGLVTTYTPTTYLLGDVVFSPQAIKTIIETQTDDIEFFASAPPFSQEYHKKWAEPFAFKVVDYQHLERAKQFSKLLESTKIFRRKPIAWEFWQVVKNTDCNVIDYTNYTVINDYTCDIDSPEDIKLFKGVI